MEVLKNWRDNQKIQRKKLPTSLPISGRERKRVIKKNILILLQFPTSYT